MGATRLYPVTPIGKPRMTRRDQWLSGARARPAVARYRAFKDEVRARGLSLDVTRFYHVVAIIPMPPSWSSKKRAQHLHEPHRTKPDKDNIEKALLDALYTDDAHAWHGCMTKVWGESGALLIADALLDVSPKGIRAVLTSCAAASTAIQYRSVSRAMERG